MTPVEIYAEAFRRLIRDECKTRPCDHMQMQEMAKSLLSKVAEIEAEERELRIKQRIELSKKRRGI